MKKKVLALVLVLVLLVALAPMALADSVTVNVSVSVTGKLVVAAQPVTLTDDVTVQGAIIAAHKAYYSGGEAGYAAGIDKTYNMFLINTCWGVTTVPYVIQNNGMLVTTADTAPVANGDNIILCLTDDTTKAATPVTMSSTVTGDKATVTATSWKLDFTTFTYSSTPLANAAVVDSTGAALGTTDATGSATVATPKNGIVCIDGLAAINVNGVTAAAASPSPSTTPAATQQAVSNFATVTLNGVAVSFDSYVINQETYFKLRDIAYKLNGTAKQFGVGWDGAKNAISLTSNTAYTADGSEMASKGSGTKTATPTSSAIYLDGKLVTFTAYTIGQNNYFRLRDLGKTFDFGVSWDDASKTVKIDTSTGYTA